MASKDVRTKGRLLAHPTKVNGATAGLQPLTLGVAPDSYLYVPTGAATRAFGAPAARCGRACPTRTGIAAELNGHGRADTAHPRFTRAHLGSPAGRRNGPDATLIGRALEHTFSRYAVDPARLAIGGFSDGASYARSSGITNGDLFTHMVAFSPGFVAPAGHTGSPRVFVSHGTRDDVLPIDRCSRRIIPELERGGYDVLYREFDGGHTILPEIASEAIGWFTRRRLS